MMTLLVALQAKSTKLHISYLFNNFKNFNKIFKKNVAYNNNKSHKNQDFTVFLKDTFSEISDK